MTFSDPSQPIIRAICGAALFVGDLSAEMIDHLFMVREEVAVLYVYSGAKAQVGQFLELTNPEIVPLALFSHCKLKVHAFPKFEKTSCFIYF